MTTQRHPFVEHFKLVFFLETPGNPVRVEVTPRAMVQCFDAHMTPKSLLDAYYRHQAFLHDAASSRAAGADAPVVLDTEDLDAHTLSQQDRESLNASISLKSASRSAVFGRRDSYMTSVSHQDARLAARAAA